MDLWYRSKAEIYAKKIVDNVSKGTGLKNRGVKTNPKLYELRKTSMPAVLVEVCFCEATEDVRIYKEKGPDLIGKLIAEAINGNEIEEDIKPESPEDSLKEKFLKSTNAKAIVDLDPRDNPSSSYRDLGEIYKGERIRVYQRYATRRIICL